MENITNILLFISENQITHKTGITIDPVMVFKPLYPKDIKDMYLCLRKHAFFTNIYKPLKDEQSKIIKLRLEMDVNGITLDCEAYFVLYCLFLIQQANEFIIKYNNRGYVDNRMDELNKEFYWTDRSVEIYDDCVGSLEGDDEDCINHYDMYIDPYRFFNSVIDLIRYMTAHYEEWGLQQPDDNFMVLLNDRLDEIEDCNKKLFYSAEDDLQERLQAALAEIEHLKLQPSNTQRQFTAEQLDLLKSYFVSPFKGMGNNVDYFNENLLLDLKKNRTGIEYAKIAKLIYQSTKAVKTLKEKPFSQWYKTFCNLMNIEQSKYKPSQITIDDTIKREFYYLT